MTAWGLQWLSGVRERLRQRRDLLLEFIVLRHQLAVLQRTGTRRPCFRPSERLFWVFLARWWANWQRGLIIVQPATVLRWRRRGFWAIGGSGSCRRASPRRKLPGIRELHTIIGDRAQSQADHNSFTAIALCVCHEQSETPQKLAPKSKDLKSLLLPGDPAAIRPSRTRL